MDQVKLCIRADIEKYLMVYLKHWKLHAISRQIESRVETHFTIEELF